MLAAFLLVGFSRVQVQTFGELSLIAESDRRIRVRIRPKQAGPPQPALALVEPGKGVATKVERSADQVTLTTKALRVQYNYRTHALRFFDLKGKLLMEEPVEPRSFKPVEVTGFPGFSLDQRFTMQPGEAYFGLGGHQRDGLNYRGDSVSLVQRNTETAVPFLLSSRGYGILANSACAQIANFGGGTETIPTALLTDDKGAKGGLTGHYFEGKNFEKQIAERRDSTINFSWLHGPIDGIGHSNFSVRWTGYVTAQRTGEYSFNTRADDGARVWVDNQQVVDDWTEKPASESRGHLHLIGGKRYPIRVEYFQSGGESEISLKWRPPSDNNEIEWKSEFLTQQDYTFIAGPSFDDIISEYRQATGVAPLFGRWAYGYWQCKERYKTQQELLDIAGEFRRRHIPIDNLVQDWFYWDPHSWGSHQFDEKRYPDMAAAIDKLHAENIHLMISVWAKFLPGSTNYTSLDRAGHLYPALTDKERYYDAFDPAARAMYWSLMRDELLTKGIDAWWLDASEPEVPMNLFRPVKTHLGPGAEVLNAFPLMHTEAVYKGQRTAKPNSRVFILTRSAYAGQQRNAAAVWSGDITGDWDTFRKQVSGGLNFCMSGLPYWCTDIGGFFSRPNTDPDYQNLFVRWFEWGAFNPIFRVHGTGTDKEPWRWSPEREAILLKYDKLRYRLMPYIYSLAWRVTHEGYTMMRGLPMDFREDPKVYDITDEFMFGPSLLIAPVTRPKATSRSVYLPSGLWYDFWTGKPIAGGRTIKVLAGLEKLPIFVRAGSILPIGEPVEYAKAQTGLPIQLWVYPGRDGMFNLYEDAGEGYGYEHGEYATISINWNDRQKLLVVGKRTGRYPGMGPAAKLTKRLHPTYK